MPSMIDTQANKSLVKGFQIEHQKCLKFDNLDFSLMYGEPKA